MGVLKFIHKNSLRASELTFSYRLLTFASLNFVHVFNKSRELIILKMMCRVLCHIIKHTDAAFTDADHYGFDIPLKPTPKAVEKNLS